MAKDTTVPDAFIEAENLLSQIDKTEDGDMGASFGEALTSALAQMIEKSEKTKNQLSGVRFNLVTLDKMLGTVQNGHFVLLEVVLVLVNQLWHK